MRLALGHWRTAVALGALLAVGGCGSSTHTQTTAPAGRECHAAKDCAAALTSLFGRNVLLPHTAALELTRGRLMEPPAYVPLGLLSYLDRAVNVRFDFSAAHQGAGSQPLAVGCATTPVHRILTSPAGRRACYQHLYSKLSTQFFHDGLVYTAVVTDPAAPRGTASNSTTRWLARLLDSYS